MSNQAQASRRPGRRGSQTILAKSPSSSALNPRGLVGWPLTDDCVVPHRTQRTLPNYAGSDSTQSRRDCIRELAEEAAENAAKSLRRNGHQLPDPLPELQALQEALHERRAAARALLMSRLKDVTKTELKLLDAAVGEQMNRLYLQCYVAWRLRDENIVARAVRSAGTFVERGPPAA